MDKEFTQMTESQAAENPVCAMLHQMIEGSTEASWELAQEIGGHIRRVARRHANRSVRKYLDSDDYVQNVWASIIRISPTLKDIRSDAQLFALLTSLTRNRVIDQTRQQTAQIRAAGRTQPITDGEGEHPSVDYRDGKSAPLPDDIVSLRDEWDTLMEHLTPVQRDMAEMRLKGHTYDEIAECFGISKRTVTRLFSRLSEIAKKNSLT